MADAMRAPDSEMVVHTGHHHRREPSCQSRSSEQIGPITQEVGVPGPPELTFYDVHNHLTAG